MRAIDYAAAFNGDIIANHTELLEGLFAKQISWFNIRSVSRNYCGRVTTFVLFLI